MTSSALADLAQLAPGGDDSSRFEPSEAWYPVHYVEDLDKSQPTPFTLLDRDLVIWWDKHAKEWRAFDDKCPHRLARLSEGRIAEDGLLECPYHGWAFTGAGTCDRIPQQLPTAKAETSHRACVKSLPTAVRQGLLFIYPGTPEKADRTPVPTIPVPMSEMGVAQDGWIVMNTFRDLPYDALTLLENVLDPSHLPYTHHRSVGNRNNAGPVELEVTEFGKQGFQGIWAEGPRRGTMGPQTTTFIAPGLMWHDLTSPQFGRTLTVVYATPIRKGECRLFARFPFKFASKLPAFLISHAPVWSSHFGQNAILEDDQIFLHHQERYLEQTKDQQSVAKAFYLPTRADRFVLALHQWQQRYQADPFPGETLPPALSRNQLLDRYYSHTVHCKSCRQALQRIKRLRQGLISLACLAWGITPILAFGFGGVSLPIAIATTSLVFAATTAWWGLRRLEQRFYIGRTIPPRNHPDK
ncbi:MAG: Rieske 2Fe-2S domain-containing protein [Acaryochloridaceae cyanobacterium CSU_5_19]|nr:Rieske 2Fe-2S domain-containing protein [Acaryochloridaceae cyanobacterium CSU_5_19]